MKSSAQQDMGRQAHQAELFENRFILGAWFSIITHQIKKRIIRLVEFRELFHERGHTDLLDRESLAEVSTKW